MTNFWHLSYKNSCFWCCCMPLERLIWSSPCSVPCLKLKERLFLGSLMCWGQKKLAILFRKAKFPLTLFSTIFNFYQYNIHHWTIIDSTKIIHIIKIFTFISQAYMVLSIVPLLLCFNWLKYRLKNGVVLWAFCPKYCARLLTIVCIWQHQNAQYRTACILHRWECCQHTMDWQNMTIFRMFFSP